MEVHINPATWKAEYSGKVLYPRLDELMTQDELWRFMMYLPEDQMEMIQEIGGIVIVPVEADKDLLATVRSESRPGVYHEIRWGGNKSYIYCTCESWGFHQEPCKHMKDWASSYGQVDLDSPLGKQLCKILGV